MPDVQLFRASPPPLGLTVELTEQGMAIRDTLVAEAAAITAIATTEDNERCADLGTRIQTLIKTTEEDGLGLRRPYNAEADKIMAVQKSYLDPLRPHLKRIGGLSATYRQEEERKAEAERRKRAEDIVRLQEQERTAAEDARKAAEAARKAEEDVRKAAASGDLMSAVNADIAAAALTAATNAAAAVTAAAAVATTAAVAAPIPEAAKTAGQSFKPQELCWECTDINALWAARPDLCNGPTPKASAIKSSCSPERPIPGLRLFWESKVSFKRS